VCGSEADGVAGCAAVACWSTRSSWTCNRLTSRSSILSCRTTARPTASRPTARAPTAPAPTASAPTAAAPMRAAVSSIAARCCRRWPSMERDRGDRRWVFIAGSSLLDNRTVYPHLPERVVDRSDKAASTLIGEPTTAASNGMPLPRPSRQSRAAFRGGACDPRPAVPEGYVVSISRGTIGVEITRRVDPPEQGPAVMSGRVGGERSIECVASRRARRAGPRPGMAAGELAYCADGVHHT
jgi:hypothetical protein